MKYYLDLQVHTSRYSPCSGMSPEQAIAAARSRGLDGIALTEHSHCWSPEEVAALKSSCRCPSFTVLVGCEISTRSGDRSTGDLVVFGVPNAPRTPCSIDELCREVHKAGGIVMAAHPYVRLLGIGEEVYSARLDGIEVYNFRYRGRQRSHLCEQAWRQLELAGVASSDAHDVGEIGQFCTEFDDPITCEQDLLQAILARRCHPRRKPPPSRLWRWLTRR